MHMDVGREDRTKGREVGALSPLILGLLLNIFCSDLLTCVLPPLNTKISFSPLMKKALHQKINADWWKRIHFCNLQEFWELIIKQFSSYKFWKNGQKMLKSEHIIKNLLKFMIFNEKNDIFLSNNIKKKSY